MLRRIAGVGALVTLMNCQTVPPRAPVMAPPPSELPPEPALMARLEGTWTGTADVSPFGPWPYMIVFRRGASAIVGETPPPPGGPTALGGYQRLVFRHDGPNAVCEFKASIKDGFEEGRLERAVDQTTDTRVVYCHEDGCKRMKLWFESIDDGALRFVTEIDNEPHAAMTLKAGASSSPLP